MKSIITLCIVLLTSAAGLRAQTAPATAPDPNAAVISFEAEVIDFGTIKQGADAVKTFKFKNTGKTDLVIASIKGQCGCTSIPDSWPKGPIKPGASASFDVKYDTSIRVGAFDKKITVTSNASNAVVDVRIKGTVVAGTE